MLPAPDNVSLLTKDAMKIWAAGVNAVDSAALVRNQIHVSGNTLTIAGHCWSPGDGGQICVVGAGKAGAGMAAGLEQAFGCDLLKRIDGWINVPEDCVQPLKKIHLHGARPAGVNEPTGQGIRGTQEILKRVRSLRSHDLCIVLISGGGSALLPAPIPEITLEEKLELTRTLSRNGATIQELNAVRSELSEIKGGGLLRACGAGLTITLIISDVIGDPLETIASGPTILRRADPDCALSILKDVSTRTGCEFPATILQVLGKQSSRPRLPAEPTGQYFNHVIGNNATAVQAAAQHAIELGYDVLDTKFDQAGVASSAGRSFAEMICEQHQAHPSRKVCLVSGGETTVELSRTTGPQRGGRNQEFALAALCELRTSSPASFAIVSGGTDGEDGPTDAAGAFVDNALLERTRVSELDPEEFLRVNNSYDYFDQINGLIKTGPTHTNVMDLRVALAAP
ncbi:glycerate kinase type-2 family protein [Planctomicrobium sp. SH668]|uniref:glycerate kinase type-2 family protein n=1 Tax=Planctomicrobium sp. SH668 TaxID=3448126 RepID=UPI003F5CACC3